MPAHVATAADISPIAFARDALALGKPRLSSLVLATTAAGVALAPHHITWPRAFGVMLATTLLVAAANTFNSLIERHTDRLMRRTMQRPLPADRLSPQFAFSFGLTLLVLAVPALWVFGNPLCFGLGLLAFGSYVFVYTPLKRHSTWALLVGAVPGAIPPALGWVSVTGTMDSGAWALFAILFVWQLPHFLAISLYLREDYGRAGLRVFSLVHGEQKTVRAAIVSALLLVPVGLSPWLLSFAQWPYAVLSVGLAGWMVAVAWQGLSAPNRVVWARKLFFASLVYLTLLFLFLAIWAR